MISAVSVCSVVCVGGDGMFSEIMHGLVSRTQQEAGVNENSMEESLMPCGLRIGIIPAGSSTAVFLKPGTGASSQHMPLHTPIQFMSTLLTSWWAESGALDKGGIQNVQCWWCSRTENHLSAVTDLRVYTAKTVPQNGFNFFFYASHFLGSVPGSIRHLWFHYSVCVLRYFQFIVSFTPAHGHSCIVENRGRLLLSSKT